MKLDMLLVPLGVACIALVSLPMLFDYSSEVEAQSEPTTTSVSEDAGSTPESVSVPEEPHPDTVTPKETRKEREARERKERYEEAHTKCAAECRKWGLRPVQCDTKTWECMKPTTKEKVCLWGDCEPTRCAALCRDLKLRPLQCDNTVWRCWNPRKEETVCLWASESGMCGM